MATWHQQQRPVPLWNEKRWTVVSDAPNKGTGLMLFDTAASARTYLDKLKCLGKAEHSYILPPGGI